MVLQVAVQDIGQVTDIRARQPLVGVRSQVIGPFLTYLAYRVASLLPAATSSGLHAGLGGQLAEYLDVLDVLLPPRPAVAQARVLLFHSEHPGDAHSEYGHAVKRRWLIAERTGWGKSQSENRPSGWLNDPFGRRSK